LPHRNSGWPLFAKLVVSQFAIGEEQG
jgi:hypothetical protein